MKEYRKKKKKDTSLEFLEFGSFSESEKKKTIIRNRIKTRTFAGCRS
jgi:hypothetical protein